MLDRLDRHAYHHSSRMAATMDAIDRNELRKLWNCKRRENCTTWNVPKSQTYFHSLHFPAIYRSHSFRRLCWPWLHAIVMAALRAAKPNHCVEFQRICGVSNASSADIVAFQMALTSSRLGLVFANYVYYNSHYLAEKWSAESIIAFKLPRNLNLSFRAWYDAISW